MEYECYMRADAQLAAGGSCDLESMLGTWINADPETDHIVRFTLGEQDAALALRVFGAGTPESIDWGAVEATPVVVGDTLQGAGFRASYRRNSIETILAANYAKGVLVIQSFTTFEDGSGRPNHFSREFFHQ